MAIGVLAKNPNSTKHSACECVCVIYQHQKKKQKEMEREKVRILDDMDFLVQVIQLYTTTGSRQKIITFSNKSRIPKTSEKNLSVLI